MQVRAFERYIPLKKYCKEDKSEKIAEAFSMSV